MLSDISHRPSVYGLCRSIVYTLWRSHGLNKNAVLSLVFKDQTVITLDGQRLILDTTRRSGVAPTERNLLTPLEQFIHDQKSGRKPNTLGIHWYEYSERIEAKPLFNRLNWRNLQVSEIVQEQANIKPLSVYAPCGASDRDILLLFRVPARADPLAATAMSLGGKGRCTKASIPGNLTVSGMISLLHSHHHWGRLAPALARATPV